MISLEKERKTERERERERELWWLDFTQFYPHFEVASIGILAGFHKKKW
jgi:hypothetical protein